MTLKEEMRSHARELKRRWMEGIKSVVQEEAKQRETVETLAANLTAVTDLLEGLLEDGKFPARGRSADSREAHERWWEDRFEAVRRARKALKQAENPGI